MAEEKPYTDHTWRHFTVFVLSSIVIIFGFFATFGLIYFFDEVLGWWNLVFLRYIPAIVPAIITAWVVSKIASIWYAPMGRRIVTAIMTSLGLLIYLGLSTFMTYPIY